MTLGAVAKTVSPRRGRGAERRVDHGEQHCVIQMGCLGELDYPVEEVWAQQSVSQRRIRATGKVFRNAR